MFSKVDIKLHNNQVYFSGRTFGYLPHVVHVQPERDLYWIDMYGLGFTYKELFILSLSSSICSGLRAESSIYP